MRVADLTRMLQDILAIHGNIQIRCGQYRIGGIMLLRHGTEPPVAVIVSRPIGAPSAGLPPYVAADRRRKTPKRRCDD
jgi:hypothetical protein